ncbi:MAG: hypothetical protein K2Z80_32760 [Xanthobacteraceae bacterium]|nr:hypothetical protein [Xanthobacteraceae bacterium]
MTRRKPGSSHERVRALAAEIAGPQDAPLDVLLGMMRDPGIGSRERIEIAKICLPFVHPRIAQLGPSENEPEREPVDISDPRYMHELIRALAFSLSASAHQRREVPGHIWDLLRCIPRGPADLKAPAPGKASGAPHR